MSAAPDLGNLSPSDNIKPHIQSLLQLSLISSVLDIQSTAGCEAMCLLARELASIMFLCESARGEAICCGVSFCRRRPPPP